MKISVILPSSQEIVKWSVEGMMEGFDAAAKGVSINQNPYSSLQAKIWESGWNSYHNFKKEPEQK